MAIITIIDGTFSKKTYASVWEKEYSDSLDNDMQRIIACALKASSGYNMQPWKVKILDDNTVELHADMDKTLDVVDSGHEILLISQGTFIKEFEIGAQTYGYTSEVTTYDIDLSVQSPLVATIVIVKNEVEAMRDATSSATLNGNSEDNKVNLKETLDAHFTPINELDYLLIDNENGIDELKELLLQGTIVESNNEMATREIIDIFRFNKKDKNKYRYGLTLSMNDFISAFVGTILKATSDNWESFGKSSITQFESRLEKEIAYIVITCDNPNDNTYLQTGYMLQQLGHNLNGYQIRPAVQILQDLEGMEELRAKFYEDFTDNKQALIIIGVKNSSDKASPATPRHLVEDIIIE